MGREGERCRENICREELFNFKHITGLYFDGRKNATQVMLEGPNGKNYRSIEVEEHYVLVGEPGIYYLTHLTSSDGKARILAQKIFEFISETELSEKLTIIRTDVTALMIGRFKGAISSLKKLIKNLLHSSISAFCTPINFLFDTFLWNLMAQLAALIALLDL